MRALLDINVLIALLDRGHLSHQTTLRWMEMELPHGWATCPITQNGVIRIMAQPAYPNQRPAAKVVDRLAEACSHPSHEFWPEDISLVRDGLVNWTRVLGSRQITDLYLLALAASRGGRFVTLDQRIQPDLVSTATAEHLSIIPAE